MGAAEAAIASAVIAGVGTGVQIHGARKSRKAATAESDRQQAKQKKAMAKESERMSVAEANKMRDAQRARQRAGAAQFGGRQSTILTGGPRSDVLGTQVGAAGVGSGSKSILGN